jgi:hypothetical protein
MIFAASGCPGCKREEGYQAFQAPLRDQFAIAALTGVTESMGVLNEGAVARKCYLIADAMLSERSKGREG